MNIFSLFCRQEFPWSTETDTLRGVVEDSQISCLHLQYFVVLWLFKDKKK